MNGSLSKTRVWRWPDGGWLQRARRCGVLLPAALVVCLAACSDSGVPQTAPTVTGSLRLQDVLAGEAGEFLRADAPRQFRFPDDHALHPGFRNEWWYFTGNLDAADGHRFGYQLTFFTSGLPQTAATEDAGTSAWESPRIWMAHLALTDAAGERHHAFERFSRENPGLAGAQLQPQFAVWLDDWRVSGAASGDTLPWQLQAAEGELALQLTLDSSKAPVLQGDAGLSRKSAQPGNASYYYSMTRMPSRGSIRIGTQQIEVSGLSWLDREWSTSALDADQSGWDWFSLQFDDGRELMLYRLRNGSGDMHPFSAGNLTAVDGSQHALDIAAMQLQETGHWTSPAGTTYGTRWQLTLEGRRIEVRAIVQEQWMNLSLPYWEGAVDVLDTENGAQIGRGYLEMVR